VTDSGAMRTNCQTTAPSREFIRHDMTSLSPRPCVQTQTDDDAHFWFIAPGHASLSADEVVREDSMNHPVNAIMRLSGAVVLAAALMLTAALVAATDSSSPVPTTRPERVATVPPPTY
jgi:hypothetical protein